MALRSCLAALLLLIAASAVRAADIENPREFDYSALMSVGEAQLQVKEFQEAVASRSCFQVAALTRFPLMLNYYGKTKWISNRTALCRYFSELFNEARSEIVAKTLYQGMPIGYRGLMFGRGEFLLQPVCLIDPVGTRCPSKDLRLRLTSARL